MYFVLSKILLVFIFPLTWIIVLLLAAFIVKKPTLKYRLLITAVLFLLIFTNPFLLGRVINCWDIPPQLANNKNTYSAAIILGGYASEDAAGRGHFNTSADRFIQAVKLKHTGKIEYLVITGGNASLNPTAFREGEWVRSQLPIFHIPDNAVLMENRSRNTIENAAYAKQLLNSNKLKPPYLLVTSAFHMRRAMYIFKKAGVQVEPYSCDYTSGHTISVADFIPDAATLSIWNTYIKEMMGITAAYFTNIPAR
ncbi:MAG: YdcF family protein [Sphingobacteriaceae bacterium]|nr:MAG: YdcF family protein [Sphingobacteriaceae bacterium]